MEDFLLEPSLLSITAIAIMDNDGNRILAKYYDKHRSGLLLLPLLLPLLLLLLLFQVPYNKRTTKV